MGALISIQRDIENRQTFGRDTLDAQLIVIQLSVDEVENDSMIRSGEDRGETRKMNGGRGIISRIDESVVVAQRAVLADVTLGLDLLLMPGGNAVETDLGHRFEGAETSVSHLIGGDVRTQCFAVAQGVDVAEIVVVAGMGEIGLAGTRLVAETRGKRTNVIDGDQILRMIGLPEAVLVGQGQWDLRTFDGEQRVRRTDRHCAIGQFVLED